MNLFSLLLSLILVFKIFSNQYLQLNLYSFILTIWKPIHTRIYCYDQPSGGFTSLQFVCHRCITRTRFVFWSETTIKWWKYGFWTQELRINFTFSKFKGKKKKASRPCNQMTLSHIDTIEAWLPLNFERVKLIRKFKIHIFIILWLF